MEYTIGEVAKQFNLSISQIRYYDKEGLFVSLKKVNGIRKFNEKDIDALFIIECLKKSGLQIKEIKQFMEWNRIGDSTIPERLNFFLEQKKKVQKQIEELNKVYDLVKYKCWYYQKAKEIGSIETLEKEKNKITPEEIQALLDNAHS